ncbi:hypothetical protein GCM10025876_09830 [Demequina litorisediminis]|uniref:BPL/LPL catalytic domain-containing protein n=1 Tax=Demequina litorisediminis TaxID=1849022 RepID=A0ABQ6IAE4_9MICO|nr:biotin--[acetyl-CoA-carboxylase] ligase [Demequina litorisediminis]GMA34779.1 hypothetical protein GCM10025876_09830 [Demequina litorisediminis]
MNPESPSAVAASRAPLTADALAGIVGEGRQLRRLEVVAASPSTNTALLAAASRAPEEWPALAAMVADHQTAGRGRAGRSWATPQGAALTVSFLLRPAVAADTLGWAPLVVGLATVRALRDAGVGAYLKWPNDVVVEAGAKAIPGWGRWRKVVGILCEVVPGSAQADAGAAVVAGIGINVSQSAAELPVPHAASLATLGAASLDRVALMRSLTAHLTDALAMWGSTPSSRGCTVRWKRHAHPSAGMSRSNSLAGPRSRDASRVCRTRGHSWWRAATECMRCSRATYTCAAPEASPLLSKRFADRW